MYSLRTHLLPTLLPTTSLFLLLALLLFLPLNLLPTTTTKSPQATPHFHVRRHLQVAHSTCQGTLYPDLCVSTLASFPNLASKSVPQMISSTVNLTAAQARAASSSCSGLRRRLAAKLGPLERRALDDCLELLADTVGEFSNAISDLSCKNGPTAPAAHFHDLQTLLSGAMTNQYTCLDGFAYSKQNVRQAIERSLVNISHHVSNSLVMLKKLPGVKGRPSGSPAAEVFPEYGRMRDGFPSWVSPKDRRLLQAPVSAIKYNVTVAQDGTGNFTTVSAAVAAAPNASTTRFVIYIKAGAYFENVEVDSKKPMIMFLGDGIGKTWIKGNRSVVDGWTTFRSATVAAVGSGFIAKGISFENYAGPSKHQAVAFRSGSDLSAFYGCSFIGYQDTLYVHSLRQFYRECDIYGTIDFIFGNAAVVFQNCSLYARKPNDNQQNIFTAQGREDPNQNTGISILHCKVAAAADLIAVKSSFKTYLGRPWKEYSRTVYMLSNIEDLVDPAGWLEWNGTFALSTLYYGEYMNRGLGSNTSARVTWPGYRVITNVTEATQFTVAPFIQGNDWLNGTTIPYYPGLN
ncbi:pectinesterase-like isoform X2 [Syzygium oleosum]|uniref:pectinesterase-like isoform X2 n=1 Tax=Syzygium oleosum TaxID=219896 RepID=UPI0024BA65D5|nr:pectinesterase-like isoform X2 [Syzygium oleosum]